LTVEKIPRPAPTLSLTVEVKDLDLDAALGRLAHRTTEVRRQGTLQTGIAGQPDEISDPFFLAILIGIRVGKGGVTSEP